MPLQAIAVGTLRGGTGGETRVSMDWNEANNRLRAVQVNGNINLDVRITLEEFTGGQWVVVAQEVFGRETPGNRSMNVNNLGWTVEQLGIPPDDWVDLVNLDTQRITTEFGTFA